MCSCHSVPSLSLGLALPGSLGHPGYSSPTDSLLCSFCKNCEHVLCGASSGSPPPGKGDRCCSPPGCGRERWLGEAWHHTWDSPGSWLRSLPEDCQGMTSSYNPSMICLSKLILNFTLLCYLNSLPVDHSSMFLLATGLLHKLLSPLGNFLICFPYAYSTSIYPADISSNGNFLGNLCYHTLCHPHS